MRASILGVVVALGVVGCGAPMAEAPGDAGAQVDAGWLVDAGEGDAGFATSPMFRFSCSEVTYDGASYHWTARVEHDGGGDGNARIAFFVDGARIGTSDPFGVDPDSEIFLPGHTIDGPSGALAAGFEYQSLAQIGSSAWADAGGPVSFGGSPCR